MEAAEFYTADMEAVRATLQWLQENEDAVRAAVAKTESAS
jgi:hypothetical protein